MSKFSSHTQQTRSELLEGGGGGESNIAVIRFASCSTRLVWMRSVEWRLLEHFIIMRVIYKSLGGGESNIFMKRFLI
jgi:hypothetical protein